jgi:enoyl-CoA hydratase/carnithine racemase
VTDLVHSEQVGGFDRLLIDSPSNRNALSIQLIEEFLELVRASADGSSRGLLITHSGPAFCSGVDLRERRALGKGDDSHSRLLGGLLTQLWNYPKPVVTSVRGAVRGGGMGLLSCSDIAIASPDATFAYSETRVGVAPALVMAVTLPAMSSRRLLPWLLSGGVFSAAEALELGLVTSVDATPGTGAWEACLSELSAGAPLAQRTVKRLSRGLQGVDMAASIAEMTAESSALFDSSEAEEGMASFAEHRAPAWAIEQQ